MKKLIKNILRKTFGAFLLIILSIVDLVGLRIFVGRLYSSRIGHFCYNSENWIAHVENLSKSSHTLFILDPLISNKEIFRILNKHERVTLVYSKWGFVYLSLVSLKAASYYLVDYRIQHPERCKTYLTAKRFYVSARSEKKLRLMKKKYLNYGEHVCFISRDSAYLRVHGLEDGNFHDFRDFPFANYEKACLYLSKSRIMPVRIGKAVEVEEHNFEYLDLSGDGIPDDIAIAAIGTSKFFVSGNSGIVHVAGLFRVPVLALNYIPLRVSDFFSLPKNSVIIPKLMFDTVNQRYLSLTEMIDISQVFDIHCKNNLFEDNKIEIIENSVVDILNSVVEMNTNTELVSVGSVRKLDYIEEKLLDFVPGLEPLFREHNIRFGLRFLQRNGSILFPSC